VLVAGGALTGCVLPGLRPAHDALTPAERLQLGFGYEQAGKPDLALREYERAAVGPAASMALTCQGNVYSALGRRAEAETAYRSALAVDPDNPVALNNLAWMLAEDGRSRDEAERLIRHAIQLGAEPRETYTNTLEAVLRQP
jgi:Flp pilus assembly protein TadD